LGPFRNWTVPILMSAVFLVLFATANPVLSKWLEDGFREIPALLRRVVERFPAGWRVLMWAAVALAVWALLRFRSATGDSTWKSESTGSAASRVVFPVRSLVVRSLVLFNLLFGLQTGLDTYYLWGGGALPKGLTYAQYAHKGAYPLLAAAILAALFVLAAFRPGPGEGAMRTARRLVYLWLVQNLFLVASSAWRLRLYVDAYTLTRWRVAAMVWMLLVFCGIVWILVRIVAGRSNLWLVNANVLTAVLVLYVCCFANFDGWIARYNVGHCREVRGSGPEIDVAYLESLGPDALPALLELQRETRGSLHEPVVRGAIKRLRSGLQTDLASWRGWTLRRQRLSRLDYPHPPVESVGRP
jgi:hypothetical protein